MVAKSKTRKGILSHYGYVYRFRFSQTPISPFIHCYSSKPQRSRTQWIAEVLKQLLARTQIFTIKEKKSTSMFCKDWINWLSIKNYNFLLKKPSKSRPHVRCLLPTLCQKNLVEKVVSQHKIEKKIKAYQEARADL